MTFSVQNQYCASLYKIYAERYYFHYLSNIYTETTMIIKPGKELNVTIDDVAFGGKGVTRIDGLVCFVAGTVPGEEVKIRITSVKKRYLEADLVEVLSASEDRVEPLCEYYGECGGCQYQHMSYERQLALKESQLKQVLGRIGGLENIPELTKIAASPKAYNYRNKITLNPRKVDENFIVYGYRDIANKHLIEIKECSLAREEVNNLIPLIKRTPWGRKNTRREKPRSATMRCTAGDEPIIYYGSAPSGMPWRKESINEREFRVPLGSFYQINPEVAEELFNTVAEWVAELDVPRVIDAFCGAGFLSAGIKDKHIIGIEVDEKSIDAAHYNALQWGVQSSNYIAGDANKLINKHLKNKGDQTLLILDPPRNGCGEYSIKSIKEHLPAYILYVSCDPATLARDLKEICDDNYRVEKLALLDMFPQTSHFESMVLLKKVEK